jgi:type VI secretion system protein ImpC
MADTEAKSIEEVATLEAPDLLDQIIDTGMKAGNEQAAEHGKDLIKNLVQELIDPSMVVDKSVTTTVNQRIAAIDEIIGLQLDEILHAEEFQKLEASWRSLNKLIMGSETGENLKIRVLPAAKRSCCVTFSLRRSSPRAHSGRRSTSTSSVSSAAIPTER